jgi:hypothetical protein
MDNRINEIRRSMTLLREEMMRVEETMRDQIKRELDCAEAALRLLKMRTELAALVLEWRAAGGSERLPTVRERLSANSRSPRPKSSASG